MGDITRNKKVQGHEQKLREFGCMLAHDICKPNGNTTLSKNGQIDQNNYDFWMINITTEIAKIRQKSKEHDSVQTYFAEIAKWIDNLPDKLSTFGSYKSVKAFRKQHKAYDWRWPEGAFKSVKKVFKLDPKLVEAARRKK